MSDNIKQYLSKVLILSNFVSLWYCWDNPFIRIVFTFVRIASYVVVIVFAKPYVYWVCC